MEIKIVINQYRSLMRIVNGDINLNEKVRYGTSLRPIQSWFKNRIEALKQYVERVNSVFLENLIVDTKEINQKSLIAKVKK